MGKEAKGTNILIFMARVVCFPERTGLPDETSVGKILIYPSSSVSISRNGRHVTLSRCWVMWDQEQINVGLETTRHHRALLRFQFRFVFLSY